jgi:hypothetical protein
MMSRSIPGKRALAAAVLLAGAAGLASAGNYGRATAPHEIVQTNISPEGDEDLFVFHAGPGFKVTAAAKKAKGTTLAPVLDLLEPDGAPATVGVTTKATASAAKLTAILQEGGLNGLRLRGSAGTGACTLSWKLKPAKFPAVKADPMAGEEEKEHLFSATGGALLSWKLSFKGDGTAQVVRILDPDGVEVPYDPSDETYVTRKLTSEKVKNLPIPAARPGGVYRLVVFNDLLPSAVNLSLKVAIPKLPRITAPLTLAEPVLLSADRVAGACGSPVVVEGLNLSETPRGFSFGTVPAQAVVVEGGSALVPGDGTSISCRAPGGQGTVDLVFEAADGQVAVLLGAFTFDPLPTVTSFDPKVGPGQGGVQLTLRGTGFQTEGQDLYDVLVGGVPASQVQVLDATTITCLTPAHVAGPKSVVLRDRCGQDVTAPGTFTYGTGLFITTIRPEAVPAFGGVPVLVSGSNLSSTDQVFLDGVLVPTTPVTFNATVIAHRIAGPDLPPHAPGAVDVRIAALSGAETTKVDGIAYYTFADATAGIPAASATDDWGGVSNALLDRDGDGTADWILVTHTAPLSGTRPGTRLLANDGSGNFTDATAAKMPEVDGDETLAANKILVGRLNADGIPDVFLCVEGSGVDYDQNGDGTPDWIEARMVDNKSVDPWCRLLFPDNDGAFKSQAVSGENGLFAIAGKRFCDANWACVGVDRPNVCYLFDADFRGFGGTMGDLDGDLDADVVLVNKRSLATFKGLSQGIWVGCYYGLVNYQYYEAKGYGFAMRVLTSSSNGGLTDRTSYFMETAFTPDEDFRAVAAAVGDVDGDFLNDIVITHNEPMAKAGNPVSATRFLRQRNSGTSVQYRLMSTFFPDPSSTSDDDWRGDAVALGDLNTDFYRDVVVSLDDDPVLAGSLSTRILLHDPFLGRAIDRTATVLQPIMPSGDDGRARALIVRDIDRDGDQDILISTPSDPGSGGRRTRLFLNVDRDAATGIPIFIDGSSLLPDAASDPGNAVALAIGDVNGDDHLDLVLTDTRDEEGTPAKRTRIWKQVR